MKDIILKLKKNPDIFFVTKKSMILFVAVLFLILVFFYLYGLQGEKSVEMNVEINGKTMNIYGYDNLNNINIGNDVTKEIENLTIENCNYIEDLKCIKDFTSLEELTISATKIHSLNGINELKNLKTLTFGANTVNDISALNDTCLKKLTEITLSGNDIGNDLTFISKNPKLKYVYLNECKLYGEIELGVCENLKELTLISNSIKKISGKCSKLESIYLDDNYLENIDFLLKSNDSRKIKCLSINDNPINEINGISTLINLEELRIVDTQIDDINELEGLKRFNSIYLDQDFDRSKINFLIEQFKQGDIYTKQYVLDMKYDLL